MGRGKGKNSKTATTGGNTTTNTGNTKTTGGSKNQSTPAAGSNNSNKNPPAAPTTKGKGKQAAPLKPIKIDLCIRCPDLNSSKNNGHENDFDKCCADFPPTLTDTTLLPPNTATITYDADQLWLDFTSTECDEPLEELQITTFTACQELLDQAVRLSKNPLYEVDEDDEGMQIQKKQTNLGKAKAKLSHKIEVETEMKQGDKMVKKKEEKPKVITKEALEAAMLAVRQQAEFQKMQTDFKKYGILLDGPSAQELVFGGGEVIGTVAEAFGGVGESVEESGGTEGAADDSVEGDDGKDANDVPPDGNDPSDLAFRPKNEGSSDAAPTVDVAPITTTTTPQLCPRCPTNCPYRRRHGTLLQCFAEVKLSGVDGQLPDELWSNIPTRSDMTKEQLAVHQGHISQVLGSKEDKVKVDYDAVNRMVQELQTGQTEHEGVPFTKVLAEAALVAHHYKQVLSTKPKERNLDKSFLPKPKVRNEEDMRPTALDLTPVLAAPGEVVHKHGVNFPVTATPPATGSPYSLRDALGRGGKRIDLYTNHFEVKLPDDLVLHEYKVTSTSNSPDWETATRNKRKVFMRDAIDNLPELKDHASVIATDYYEKIIAGYSLWDDNEPMEVLVYNYKPGTRNEPQTLSLTVRLQQKYAMNELKNYVHGRNMGYAERGAAEAMNIVISKAVADGAPDTFMAGNNKFYYRPGCQELSKNGRDKDKQGLIAMRGYYCSVRPGMGATTVNINTLTSAFYRQQTIAQYLASMFGGRPITKELLKKANAHLKTLRAYVNFARQRPGEDASIDDVTRRIKTIYELRGLAKDIKFKPSATNDITTVAKHLHSKYPNASGNADNAWAVNVGTKAPNEKFYLDQQLTVLSDQKYRKRLDGTQTANMIIVARRTPEQSRAAIVHEGLESLHLGKDSQHPAILKELNITVATDMMLLSGRVVDPPGVMYGNQKRVDANKGKWNTAGKQFFHTKNQFRGKPNVAFFGVNDPQSENTSKGSTFQKMFLFWQPQNGLQKLTSVTGPSPKLLSSETEWWTVENLANEMRSFEDKGVSLFVLILPFKNALYGGRHANFKAAADQLVGITSAVLCEDVMMRSVKRPHIIDDEAGLAAYMGNYAMKLNLRLGNVNHVLDPQALAPLTPDCMVLGADVTHPGNGSTKGTPSVAAVVGSMDSHFAVYSGQMRLQKGKDEPIEGMKDMTHSLFHEWAKQHQSRLPQRILLYRDGVSEGQYNMVRDDEVRDIHAGWEKAWTDLNGMDDGTMVKPEITAVIVVKRHHTRFYPKNITSSDNGKDGNCPPGTIVDTSITSPYYLDFFLQSHNPLIGTGKPAHYFVVVNEMNLTSEQLQRLTNNICYLYGRSTNAVSYASPAYYADRLCERGRQYLKALYDPPDGASDVLDAADGMETAKGAWNRCPDNNGNPWHPNLNGTMFWM
ncbi:hypothetical protein LTR17_001299 [Elasticomyces elasticus]|nr:hypothetical protein LTR17_001299 [Elasticomyces elasticus]